MAVGQARSQVDSNREAGEIGVLPMPDDVSRPFWEAARRHELQIQRCCLCGALQHRPSGSCRKCLYTDLEWLPISGRAIVYSFVIEHRPAPGLDAPYVIAQVTPIETDDNMVRIIGNIKGCGVNDVYVGMPVEVFYEDLTPEIALPQFRPTTEAKLRSRDEQP